jgi:hypothetical protein
MRDRGRGNAGMRYEMPTKSDTDKDGFQDDDSGAWPSAR